MRLIHKEPKDVYKRQLPGRSALLCYFQGYSHYVAGPSFDGMTYESLQDTLSADTRRAFLDVIRQLSEN